MVGPPSRRIFRQDGQMYSNQNSPQPTLSTPNPIFRALRFATRPVERFLQIEASSGIILLSAGIGALLWANSPWADAYLFLRDFPVRVEAAGRVVERSLLWLINDGLMVIFFFVVGLEIRREIHHGELSDWRRAVLPVAAALGGMIVPAVCFLGVAAPEVRAGWAIPMATDIAFALGVMSLLGKRVPPALRVLLLALAVIDDLGAIVVIGLFYSTGFEPTGMSIAVLGIILIFVMQRIGVRRKLLYVPAGVVVWAGIYLAGIHPTIAGVLIGFLTPVSAVGGESRPPSEVLIDGLHPWVAFFIMPVFALANAGVPIGQMELSHAFVTAAAGAFFGLLIGKPIGVVGASLIVLRLGIAGLPRGITTRHIVVLGVIAGIGFTMSLFIAGLAFSNSGLLGMAKAGVLLGSGLSAVVGIVLGIFLLRGLEDPAQAKSADEAEASTEL